MKIGPMFKWFGSKWQSAKRYPAPMHDAIYEPYVGGAGYSLNYADKAVRLFDADPNLQTLWRWLIADAMESLIREIPVGLPIGTDIRDVGLSYGQALLLKHWQRTNSCGDCWTVSPWGHLPGQWTENTRSRVATEVGAIKHWRFGAEQMDPATQATWFIDPPYEHNYRYRSNLPDFDYALLRSIVDRINRGSLVIVCEAARKSDGALPTWLPFTASHRSVTSRRKASQSHHSAEVVFIRTPT
jgi:site-specific DNA-adenine methylase